MRILFYIPDLDQTSGGIRQYSAGLLKMISELDEHEIYVLHNNHDPEIILIIENAHNLVLIPKNIGTEKNWERKKYMVARGFHFLRKKGTGKDLRVRSYLDRICRKYKIDIVHSPWQGQPFPQQVKNIFTLHDVQELHFPEFFSPEDREYRARTWLYNIERTDKIIVSFKHVKDDLIKYFRLKEEMIEVIFLNMQNIWFTNYESSDAVDTKDIHDFEEFLLCPANTWPHKNHERLLESLALLKESKNIKVNLVCVGHQNDHFSIIKNKTSDLQLENQVKFTGIVDEITLYSLYQNCVGVVIPTLYEAGSLPLIESIMMGIPVICSNVTSLPETIGNENYLFDPFNVKEMGQLIEKLWSDDDFRLSNSAHTATMRERLVNTGATEKMRELYQSL
ncbi:glycosyltransferase family 4 protein [Crocinitomix catalasitica]|nr:glycosyltransferase family 4 protein [Crocinitomix catalasitica]